MKYLKKIEAKLMSDKERAQLTLKDQVEHMNTDHYRRVQESLKKIGSLITNLKKDKVPYLRLVKPGEKPKPKFVMLDENKLSQNERKRISNYDLKILKSPFSKKEEILEKRAGFVDKIIKKYGPAIIKRAS